MKHRIQWGKTGYLPIAFGYCPSEKAWNKFAKKHKVTTPWPNTPYGRMDAIETPEGWTYYLVTINRKAWKGKPPNDLRGVIVHEAVHVWQWAMAQIGEQNPSIEFEAYAIQNITMELNKAYERAHGRKP